MGVPLFLPCPPFLNMSKWDGLEWYQERKVKKILNFVQDIISIKVITLERDSVFGDKKMLEVVYKFNDKIYRATFNGEK